VLENARKWCQEFKKKECLRKGRCGGRGLVEAFVRWTVCSGSGWRCSSRGFERRGKARRELHRGRRVKRRSAGTRRGRGCCTTSAATKAS
jgi:hypothetical protein